MHIDTPPVAFDIATGTLHIGEHEVTGFADAYRVDATYSIANTLQHRVEYLESDIDSKVYSLEKEIHELRHMFTANFVRELVRRCEEFVNSRELTGMTDEEFEAEIENLLFSGGV